MECNSCEFHPELYYDAEFQIWIKPLDDGSLQLGMTDISQTIAGRILHVRVRKPGTQRPPGKPIATLESGKWAGPVPNPIACIIVDANVQVLENPVLLNQSPYSAWIARVQPVDDIEQALSVLVTGKEAERGYCARARREEIRCQRKG